MYVFREVALEGFSEMMLITHNVSNQTPKFISSAVALAGVSNV